MERLAASDEYAGGLMSNPIRRAIAAQVQALRSGEVVSFGDVAARAGHPKLSRLAGSVLAGSMDTLPWWRVVYASGYLPPCNPTLQESKLIGEGVVVKRLRVLESPAGRFARTDGPHPGARR